MVREVVGEVGRQEPIIGDRPRIEDREDSAGRCKQPPDEEISARDVTEHHRGRRATYYHAWRTWFIVKVTAVPVFTVPFTSTCSSVSSRVTSR